MKEGWRDRLKRTLDQKGLTMRSVSLAAGMGPNYLQQALAGKDPGFEKIQLILGALGESATLYVVLGVKLDETTSELLGLIAKLNPETRLAALRLLSTLSHAEDIKRKPHAGEQEG